MPSENSDVNMHDAIADWIHNFVSTIIDTLHAQLSSAVYCYRSCLFEKSGRALCVCGFVGLLPRQLEIACIDLHQTGFVDKGGDHLQLIKFWPSCAPGERGLWRGKFFLAPPYYSQRAVFVSLRALFPFTAVPLVPLRHYIIITESADHCLHCSDSCVAPKCLLTQYGQNEKM